jgi:hypothetical protein
MPRNDFIDASLDMGKKTGQGEIIFSLGIGSGMVRQRKLFFASLLRRVIAFFGFSVYGSLT